MSKKVHCENCGTTVGYDEKSCPTCRITVKREESDGEEEFELKQTFPYKNVFMIIFILMGMILTIRGIVEYQNIDVCTHEGCGLQDLFLAGVGIIMMLAASIELARGRSTYKMKRK